MSLKDEPWRTVGPSAVGSEEEKQDVIMPVHLVPEDILAEYASGATSPAVSLLVAAQLTHSPEGRRIVRDYEELGGAMLEDEEPAEVADDALDAVMSEIGEAPDAAPAPRADDAATSPLPAPVMAHVGVPFDQIAWKFRLPGVAAYDLEGFGDDEKVQLLRARPGASIPQHTHEGVEMTLVLQGCLEDGGVAYRKGDVAINDEDDDHRPRVRGDEMCYCLIVQRGDLHFTGRFSRFLNYLGE